MGMIKDQNARDLTEAEEIKKRWQDYTELYKKELNVPDNHDGVVTDLEAHHEKVGITIARRNINNLRYADDTTLMAESEEELKSLLMQVKEESAKVGLKLNIKKTKIMASGPLTFWQIDGEEMEVVTDFIFLGSMITTDGDCSQEIKRCLLLGRKAMANLDSILKSRAITLPTKVCIVKAMVFPVAMYGCESWTIRKAERRRIEAFELCCWRRLLRVPWTARQSNRSVLEEINPDCSLEGQILKMKLKYFGHLMRRKDSLEKSLMLGTIHDKRRRGRQRMRWLDGVTEAVGVNVSGLRGMVEDKKAWRNVVHGVAMGLHERARSEPTEKTLDFVLSPVLQRLTQLFCILERSTNEPGRWKITHAPFILMGLLTVQELQDVLFAPCLLLCLCLISGNSAIVVMICLDARLHFPMYFFLCNFSVVELMVTTTVIPRMLTYLMAERKAISFGGCPTQFYFCFSLGTTVFLPLAVMSIDCYVAIYNPLHYSTFLSSRVCIQLALGSWMISFFSMIPPSIFRGLLSFCRSNQIL
ncbi:Olfactory receptor 6V1 [Varanus komodoensis]|nr:Olfactory receptor 6V1 [Varanus komodoensis]